MSWRFISTSSKGYTSRSPLVQSGGAVRSWTESRPLLCWYYYSDVPHTEFATPTDCYPSLLLPIIHQRPHYTHQPPGDPRTRHYPSDSMIANQDTLWVGLGWASSRRPSSKPAPFGDMSHTLICCIQWGHWRDETPRTPSDTWTVWLFELFGR